MCVCVYVYINCLNKMHEILCFKPLLRLKFSLIENLINVQYKRFVKNHCPLSFY